VSHPHQLHATAALWSLRRSWPLLRHAAATAAVEAADGLHSTTYGSRYSPGTHSGGPLDAILADVARQQYWTNLTDQVRDKVTQACWLVRSALPDRRGVRGPYGPFPYLAAALPHVDPATARDITGYLADADRTIRRALQLGDHREPLPGVDCPACSTRMLQVNTAAPNQAAWTVTCAAGCRCRGDACPCTTVGGQPAAGVRHIWPWAAVVQPMQEQAAA
jgi:hypothetical protein